MEIIPSFGTLGTYFNGPKTLGVVIKMAKIMEELGWLLAIPENLWGDHLQTPHNRATG